MRVSPSGRKLIARVRKNIVSGTMQKPDPTKLDRQELIDQTRAYARYDHQFQTHARDGDRLRDQGDWQGAERAYAAALGRLPYHAGYWIQMGHMLKEQGQFPEAEAAYRSGAALGVTEQDVTEHFLFVLDRQSISPNVFPLKFLKRGSPTAQQPPSHPDVELFARLLWQVGGVGAADIAGLLRRNATCDELLADMISDSRFERANRVWLSVVNAGEL